MLVSLLTTCTILKISFLAITHRPINLQRTRTQRTYQATELARNRIAPLGGRHQCRLVSRLGLHSKWQQYHMYPSVSSLRSDRYHYRLQESAKICAPVLKCHQPQGGFGPSLIPHPGSAPQTTVIGSCSRAHHTSPLPLLQTTSDAPVVAVVLSSPVIFLLSPLLVSAAETCWRAGDEVCVR